MRANFEPWWEEKDLGAPPPNELKDAVREVRQAREYREWKARGMPEQELKFHDFNQLWTLPLGRWVNLAWERAHGG